MSKEEIKQLKEKIHSQIDKLNDETALQILQEAVTSYSLSSQTDIVDELTPHQQQRLKESLQQADESKALSNEEVKEKTKEWLSR
jgi:hypothetical protein